MTAPELQSRIVLLNGEQLAFSSGDTLPVTNPKRLENKPVTPAPTRVNFIALPGAGNPHCQGF